MRDSSALWGTNGLRAHTRARNPRLFFEQYLRPLLFWRTTDEGKKNKLREFQTAEAFWGNGTEILLGEVRLKDFRLTDWFPRAPGVYWSRGAAEAREYVRIRPPNSDPELGFYVSPESKMGLIEEGGIGSIRLRPRKIDDEICWLTTALSGNECHQGIPLAIPKSVLEKAAVEWGDQVNIEGTARFLQDAGLEDTAAYVHHARPLIIFVEKISGLKTRRKPDPIIITPVALFESTQEERYPFDKPQYTFVQCIAGADSELDAAGEWITKYAAKHSGRVITNFDEQRPILSNAPLSYQKLVAKTYDKSVFNHYSGEIKSARIDQVIQRSVVQLGDTHVSNNINVGGSAIINIDSVLKGVTQTIGGAPGLDKEQKTELEGLVNSLKSDLEAVKPNHVDEVKEIAAALEKAVANASKPPQERKKSILELSAKGLKDAAETVKDVAPAILTTAGLIAKFITGLQ